MWYRLQRTIACLMAVIGLALSTSAVQAGWGHHWGHHHRHYYSGWGGWGFPSYGYSSFYYSAPRVRLYYPSYSVGYSSYYAPSVSFYAAPTYYVAPTYYAAPVVYPTYSVPTYSVPSCYDPCLSSVSYPTSSPSVSQPQYSTGLSVPGVSTSPQLASSTSGSFVDRMLGQSASPSVSSWSVASNVSVPSNTLPSHMLPSNTLPKSVSALASLSRPSDGSVRVVSTLKPVAPSTTAPANIDQLSTIPQELLKTADEMFAIGGYAEAASAYARLAVRYGNHDELAVRRFIALVASGEHAQASIVYELAVANDRPLTMSALPSGGLAKLYGANPAARGKHIDSLASYALKLDNEALPMAMVGTWLELDGQPLRAATFLQRAEMISKANESTPAPALANRLAEAQLAR